MKTCSKCGVERPYSDFWKRGGNRNGYQSYCKPCVRQRSREYDTPYRRRRQAEDPNYFRRRDLKAKYGLTIEQAEAMVAAGCGVCDTSRNLQIDHNHETGEVRGALCIRCNTLIGHLEKSPQLVEAWVGWGSDDQ